MLHTPSFAIGIPTVNRADLLNDALAKYYIDFPGIKIYIVDNGLPMQRITTYPNQIIYRALPEKNLGVAASWNQLIRMSLASHDYAIILNDDIYWGATKAQVTSFLRDRREHFFMSSTHGMCAFITTAHVNHDVGEFDEKFYPAYYEDNDMLYRMKLAGTPICETPFLDPEIFRNSQSCKKDPLLNQPYLKMRDYYVRKWGGEPGKELYRSPENR